MRFNPYRPNSIVTPKMFHGRAEELAFIQQSLLQTPYGNPQHFLIEGERGLGKSSLFLMVNQFASGKLALSDGLKMNFLVLNIELVTHIFYKSLHTKLLRQIRTGLSMNLM